MKLKMERIGRMILTKEELLAVQGGAASWTVALGIGAFITFLIGVVDGYLRPHKCD